METKEDIIAQILDMDDSIKDIDVAIPLDTAQEYREVGVDPSTFCTVYYKDGSNDVLDLIVLRYRLKEQGKLNGTKAAGKPR